MVRRMAATRIVALFDLKPGTDPQTYETWAKTKDIPTVRALSSIAGFDVRRVTGTLDGSPAPYRYVEIIDVADMETFGAEVASPAMQAIAGEFQTMVDVVFLTTEPLA